MMRILILILLILANLNTFAQKVDIKHKYITITYDTLHKVPVSVRYILKADSINKIVAFRSEFHYDTLLKRKHQNEIKTYYRSTYDKGHLAPDRDFTYSLSAEYEVMSMTNVVPQNPNLNRGVWRQIESYVRTLSYRFDSLEVVTGTIYTDTTKLKNIPVPTYIYKTVNTYKYKLIFLAKNQDCTDCDGDDLLIDQSELDIIKSKSIY